MTDNELEAKLEADERDARRYRWLRDQAKREGRDGGWWGYWVLPFLAGWDHTPYSKERGKGYDHVTLDAAIDAALAVTPKEAP